MLETLKANSSSQWKDAMDITIDNQQTTDVMYATYLQAMLDGEGCVQLIPWNNRGRRGYQARISIFNQDPRILAALKAALVHFDIPFYIYAGGISKLVADIRISRLTGIAKFLSVILQCPLLGKRQECALLREFVLSRLDKEGKPYHSKACKYSLRDEQIAAEIKAIRASQRAYVELNPPGSKDVLWSALKDAEVAEMTTRVISNHVN